MAKLLIGVLAAICLVVVAQAAPNDILSCITPTGASRATASQDRLPGGVQSSYTMAATDQPRLIKSVAIFNQVAQKYGVPSAVLAAIASRESRAGAVLQNGWGDNHNAYGVMQVDVRFHKIDTSGGPFGVSAISQGAAVLMGMFTSIKAKHSTWTVAQQFKGAICAYNAGPGNVGTVAGMDIGTTGNDYSNDVWARAIYLSKNGFGPAPGACQQVVSGPGAALRSSMSPNVQHGNVVPADGFVIADEMPEPAPKVVAPKPKPVTFTTHFFSKPKAPKMRELKKVHSHKRK